MTTLPNIDWTRLSSPPGSRIVVAGGAGDIGRAVVRACLVNGHQVTVLDLPRSLERHPPESGVLAIPLDATDPPSVTSALATLGRHWPAVDALVFVVGFTITPPARLDEIGVAQWDDVSREISVRRSWWRGLHFRCCSRPNIPPSSRSPPA